MVRGVEWGRVFRYPILQTSNIEGSFVRVGVLGVHVIAVNKPFTDKGHVTYPPLHLIPDTL